MKIYQVVWAERASRGDDDRAWYPVIACSDTNRARIEEEAKLVWQEADGTIDTDVREVAT